MSKERLEEIKKRLVLLHNAIDVDDETKNYIFKDLKVERLIERVQELENEVLVYKTENRTLGKECEKLRKRVQELERENRALRVIASDSKKVGELYIGRNKRYREAIEKGINATRYTNPEVAYNLSESLEGAE